MNYYIHYKNDFLAHYGTKGMKWGVVNEDETAAAKAGSAPGKSSNEATKTGGGSGAKKLSSSTFNSVGNTQSPLKHTSDKALSRYNSSTSKMTPDEAREYVLKTGGDKNLAELIYYERNRENSQKKVNDILKSSGWEDYFTDMDDLTNFVNAYRGESSRGDGSADKECFTWDKEGNMRTIKDAYQASVTKSPTSGQFNEDQKKKASIVVQLSNWMSQYENSVSRETYYAKEYKSGGMKHSMGGCFYKFV